MSKYVKNLLTDQVRQELSGVSDCLVISIAGLPANTNWSLRNRLREKKINLRVIKNSLARRATEGTALAPNFTGLAQEASVVWGGGDIVSLAKEIVAIAKEKGFEKLLTRGGAMEGAPISADQVEEVSKWPSRGEQLSILVGQILSPGAKLSGQLLGPGGMLASQIKKKSEAEEGAEGDAAAEGAAAEGAPAEGG